MGGNWSMFSIYVLSICTDESGILRAEYCRKVLSGRKAVCAVRSLVNASGLSSELNVPECCIMACLCRF